MRLISTLSLLVLATACADSKPQRQVASIDDFGDSVVIGTPPTRIVSLNETVTELLFALGAGDRLVGRTRWAVYPDSARLIPDLGDGIRPNVEAVLAARPDLVILYGSADNQPAARTLRAAKIPTLALKIDRISDFQRAVPLVAAAVGDLTRGGIVLDSVMASLERAREYGNSAKNRPTVFWHMWDSPLLTIGGASYLSELVSIAGGYNVYDSIPKPSPQISFEDLAKKDPDIILAAPQGVARILADPAWKNLKAVRTGRVLTVDTLLVFRPSVRLGEAALSLARLIHPDSTE